MKDKKTNVRLLTPIVIGAVLTAISFYKFSQPAPVAQRGIASDQSESDSDDKDASDVDSGEHEARHAARAHSESTVDVVIFGDSQAAAPGAVGETLYKKISEFKVSQSPHADFRVRAQYTCGSRPGLWVEDGGYDAYCGQMTILQDGVRKMGALHSHSPSFEEFMEPVVAHGGKRIVILQQGSNMLGPKGAVGDLPKTKVLLEQVKAAHAECIWVGPPQPGLIKKNPVDYEEMNRTLKKFVEAEGCQYVDSNLLTDRKRIKPGDLHYPGAAGRDWGEGIFRKIEASLRSVASGGGLIED